MRALVGGVLGGITGAAVMSAWIAWINRPTVEKFVIVFEDWMAVESRKERCNP